MKTRSELIQLLGLIEEYLSDAGWPADDWKDDHNCLLEQTRETLEEEEEAE